MAEAANAATILSLESRNSLEIGLADLMLDGKLEIFPHVEKRGLLFLNFKTNHVKLSAGPYIGLIPLTPRVTIDVRPKLPVGNLARVLDAARGSLGSISGVDRLYLASDQSSNSVLEFLAANLVDSVREVGVNGLLKEYSRRSEITSSPSGRVQIAETVRSCWSKGQFHRLAVQRFEQTSDVPVNRAIRSALHLALRRLRPATPTARALLKRLNQAYQEFPDVVRPISEVDFDACRSIARSRRLPSTRAYYYRPLEIALLMLSDRGVSLLDRGEDVLLETFIINFDVLVEEYLRRVLQLRATGGIVVRDGNHEGRKPLFDDTRVHEAQPDIVVWSRPNDRRVIAEVKYKEKPNRDDINQAVTYALSYGTGRAVLVHQNRPGARTGLRHIGTVDKVVIEAYAFDLGNPDLESEERAFSEAIFGMVSPPVIETVTSSLTTPRPPPSSPPPPARRP